MNPSVKVPVSPHRLQRESRVTSTYVNSLLLKQCIPYMSLIGTVEGNTLRGVYVPTVALHGE